MATTTRKTHVVLECADPKAVDARRAALEAAGFSVTVCPGPDASRRRMCPLRADEPCPWVDAADVVVHDLDLDIPEHRAVLRALRRTHPGTPIVLELPEQVATRHADVLRDCHVVYPFDMDRFVKAVAGAVQPSADDKRARQGPRRQPDPTP